MLASASKKLTKLYVRKSVNKYKCNSGKDGTDHKVWSPSAKSIPCLIAKMTNYRLYY